jgi:hypothetical protein
MNKIKGQYRQGDVLIQRVETIPASAVLQKHDGKIIVAHGEATGHAHQIDSTDADWWKHEEDQFVQVKTAAPLTHQEHSKIPLKRGRHVVRRQREYSPSAIRNVAD